MSEKILKINLDFLKKVVEKQTNRYRLPVAIMGSESSTKFRETYFYERQYIRLSVDPSIYETAYTSLG